MTKIVVKKLDETGHSSSCFADCGSAADYVNKQVSSDNYCVMLDGDLFGSRNVSASDLEGISAVVLTTKIVGG